MRLAHSFVLLTAWAPMLAAQPAGDQTHRMEVTLERFQNGEWAVVDPGLVFDEGDRVRFRFRANFDGYLYVMNQGTSGKYELLFPREETGDNNRIERGTEYQIPATQAVFRVAGPPGQDIVYWLVTPIELSGAVGASAAPPLPRPGRGMAPPKTLRPRCDDSILRARGECVDSTAGPRNVSEDAVLPENLAAVPRLHSRELVIMKQGREAIISSPAAQDGPSVYEFRLAHR